MEKRGFTLCVDRALESGIYVDTLGTDRQLGIWALVKKEYKVWDRPSSWRLAPLQEYKDKAGS